MKNEDRLAKINELKISIDSEIEQRGEPQTIIDHMSNRALSDLQSRLINIKNILLIEKYDLVFIGQVGVGKTTAICHLFQLVMESKKKKRIRNRDYEIEVIEELMATGAGFTTLCEVVVKQDSSTFIEIDPYSTEEIQKIIDDFCCSIWLKTYPNLDNDPKDQGTLPPELTRALRNLVNLPTNPKSANEKDPAIKLASDFGENSFNEFLTEVINRANMADRNEVQIFPEKEVSNLKLWLKETYSKLNLAKIPSFSIPRKIKIHLQPPIILVGNDRIGSIVDTKGVDSGQFNRQDLDTYIRDRNNSICFFTEKFPAAPSNVMDIIERHMTKEARDISTKIILFVLPRDNEPENVVGQDGPVEERDIGLSIRYDQILDGFNSRGISFPKENILFYDPLEYYEAVGIDHRKLPDIEQKDIDNERERIFYTIEQIILRREDLVWNEVQEKEKLFFEIKGGRGLDSKEEKLIEHSKQKIREYSHLDFVNADRFFDEYQKPWLETRHVMTLRATNNRDGVYPPRDIDVCYDAKPVVEKLVRQLATGRKEKILKVISGIKEQVTETSELQRLMPILEDRVNSVFEEFIRETANKMKNNLENVVFYPKDDTNPFWLEVQDRYGKGPGYRADVLAMYEYQFGDYEGFLRETAEFLWEDMVIDRVLDFLG